jgi:N6-adenosine-specific RNA methylase IME4
MKIDNKLTRHYSDVVVAIHDLGQHCVDQGLIDPAKMRMTIAERQKTVKALANSGLSQRQIAKAAGISQSQVQRDLTQKGSQSGPKRVTKAEKRAEREAELTAKVVALPTKRYGVIVADPEWRFEPYNRETGMDRAADNHYPTNSTEIIMARDVASIAAEDCVLFLWATVPMLRDALSVMESWGFEYRSHAIWDKIHIGTGYWFRNRHELLLVGTKGNIPAPAMGDQFASVTAIARKEHSAKPEQFLQMIEQYFPTLPKIELNRRGPSRFGWDAWGNEFKEAAE